MEDRNRRECQAQDTAIILQTPDEHLAGYVGRGANFSGLRALVIRNKDILGGIHAVIHVSVVGRAAVKVFQTDGVREVRPGAEGR